MINIPTLDYLYLFIIITYLCKITISQSLSIINLVIYGDMPQGQKIFIRKKEKTHMRKYICRTYVSMTVLWYNLKELKI